MKRSSPKKSAKSSRKKLTRKDIIELIILAIISLVLCDQLRHLQDKQKFMTLKQDMLALQTEFNKIDAGWIYSESCHASGEKFHEDVASNCYINLHHDGGVDAQRYLDAFSELKIFGAASKYSYEDYGNKIVSYSIPYKRNFGVGCGISMTTSKSGAKTATAGCHDSALDFYFPKTQ